MESHRDHRPDIIVENITKTTTVINSNFGESTQEEIIIESGFKIFFHGMFSIHIQIKIMSASQKNVTHLL